MDQKYIVTFEISSSQIKGAVASVTKNNDNRPSITVDAIVSNDVTNCVRYGRVQNIAETAKHVSDIIGKLQQNPVVADKTITGAYVGIEGRSLASEHVTASIILPTEMEITHNILRQLFDEARKNVISGQTLCMIPRRFIVDNQAMSNPVGAPAHQLRGEFTAVVCNNMNKRYLDMVFNERVKLPIHKYIVVPVAIADMVLTADERQLGCVLVDFGYQTTTVSIYKDNALQYLATLPLGSQNITQDIAALFNCTTDKAEQMKLNVADAIAESNANAETQNLNLYVKARANEIIANIKAQIEYAGYKISELSSGFILTGRGARLRNFDRLLEHNSKANVRIATISGNINHRNSNPAAMTTDYISLLSIINSVASMSKIADCLQLEIEPVVETRQPADTRPAETTAQKPKTPVQDTNQPKKPRREEISDDDILKDDPIDKGSNKGNKKDNQQDNDNKQQNDTTSGSNRISMIDRIKNRLSVILSDNNDTSID